MKLSNEFLKMLLAVMSVLSCFIFAISVFYVPNHIAEGTLSIWQVLLIIISAFSWVAISYYSEEAAWKTLLKLLVTTSAYIFLAIGGFGLKELISSFFHENMLLDIKWSIITIIIGFSLVFGMIKVGKSKWLN